MTTLDDAAVVRALLAGEPGAWDLFVARHAGLAAGVARRVLQSRGARAEPGDVDDVCEELFLMLLDRDGLLLRRYDPRHRLATYLAVLARTAAHRWLRRRGLRVQLPEEAAEEAFPDPGLRTASEDLARRELLDVLREELSGLSEREQLALRLFYFEGRDYQAIARELGVAANSVGATLSRARARLALALRGRAGLTDSDVAGDL